MPECFIIDPLGKYLAVTCQLREQARKTDDAAEASTATLPTNATKSCARESLSGQSVLSDRIGMCLESAIGVAFDFRRGGTTVDYYTIRIRSRVA